MKFELLQTFMVATISMGSVHAFALGKSSSYCPDQSYAVHLTFDDGPHPSLTERILDTLQQYKIRATFFINTSNVTESNFNRRIKVIERAVHEGHVIGFHTHQHIEHTKSTYNDEDLLQNMTIPEALLPFMSNFIRFPYGSGWFKERSRVREERRQWLMIQVQNLGYRHVGWDIDTWDWSKEIRGLLPNSVQEQICNHQGGIILMHDIQSFTAQNLEKAIIAPTLEAGHFFVALEDILELNESRPRPYLSLRPEVVGAKYCYGSKAEFLDYYDQVRASCEHLTPRRSHLP